jgi:hypothetical protein
LIPVAPPYELSGEGYFDSLFMLGRALATGPFQGRWRIAVLTNGTLDVVKRVARGEGVKCP